MGKNPHSDYFFKIKTDFTYIKVKKDDLNVNNEDVSYIIKTVFNYNAGLNYTYSTHTIFDTSLNPTYLKVGKTQSIGAYSFKEFIAKEHCATIKIIIKDSLGIEKSLEFNHGNGLYGHNTDRDGEGIFSFIKCLQLMNQVEEWGSWKAYDKAQEFKIIVAAKLHLSLQPKADFVCDLLEVDWDFWTDMIKKYNEKNWIIT